MEYEYTMAPVRATGSGIFSRTPTEGNIERELRRQSAAGWRLVQVLTLGLLFRRTWLILERARDEANT